LHGNLGGTVGGGNWKKRTKELVLKSEEQKNPRHGATGPKGAPHNPLEQRDCPEGFRAQGTKTKIRKPNKRGGTV